MITATLKTWVETIKKLVTDIRGLGIFAALYAALLVTFYIFIATREATVWQVLVTYVLLVLVPAGFFVFQASIIDHARETKFHWKQIFLDAIKFAAITIPVILLGWAIWALLNKWQGHYPAPKPPLTLMSAPPKPQPTHWPTLLFATLRTLIFGVVLPLVTIHLWIEVAGQNLKTLVSSGAKSIAKRIGSVFTRAFATGSVLIYLLGVIVFFLLPYVIGVIRISSRGTKTDFAIFIVSLLLMFAFSLIGWIVTLTALTKTIEPTEEGKSSSVRQSTAEAPA